MASLSNIPSFSSPEVAGNKQDLLFLDDDKWLLDTEVRYALSAKNSRWHLSMIYISIHNPFRFLCRKIDEYHSEKKANTFAKILQRGIRKDARGTLKMNTNAFNICTN